MLRSYVSIFFTRLCGGDGLADLTATLPRVQSALDGRGSLLNDLGALGEDELDVGGARHVWVDLEVLANPGIMHDDYTYTSVGTVSAPALIGGLVDLDVLDDQVAGVETLGVGIGLSVLEETEDDLSRLDGPAGAGDAERLACSKCYSCHSCSMRLSALLRPYVHSPCAVRPVPPAYRLMGTASLCSRTFPR